MKENHIGGFKGPWVAQGPADSRPASAEPTPGVESSPLRQDDVPPLPPPPPQVVVDRAPGAPQAVESSTTAISLSWAPVVCAIHSQVAVAVEYIVNYELQMQQVDDKGSMHPDRWSVQYMGTASFVQVKGLQPGRTYAACVTAVPYVTNMAALDVVVVASPPSGTTVVQTLPCPPMGQPAPQLSSRLKKELKFKWAEPEETGGRSLEYVLQISPAPESWEDGPSDATSEGFFQLYRGRERSFLAKRLLPGMQYSGRVKAVNCEGESAWSPLGVFYTQSTVPSWSPTDSPFVWDTTTSSVTLGWPEPANNGGNITGYEVEMDDGSDSRFRYVTHCLERSCIVQGLRSGILYRFRVRAENEAGRSLWSPVGEGRTAAVPPAACLAPTKLGTSQTSLTLRWEEPEEDGGSPILYYMVEMRPRCAAAQCNLADEWAIFYQGPERACTIGGLRAGCFYMARVSAVSQAGTGASSAAAILKTAPGTPGCPGAPVALSRQQAELVVSWAAPSHDGGSPINVYRLEMCCLGGIEGLRGDGGKGKGKLEPSYELAYLGPQCNAVLSGLEPGNRYLLRCSAINEQGSSGWGHTAHADTLPGLPFPVDSLHLVAAANASLKLRWSQPYGRGAPVTNYVLEIANPVSTPLPLPPQQPLPQEPEQAANVQQQKVAELDGLQHDKPPLPLQELLSIGELDGGVGGSGSHFMPAYQGGDCSCTVNGLEPNTTYTVRVRAISEVGSSVSEPKSFVTAPAPPSIPLCVEQQDVTPSSLRIGWAPPATDHGAAITSYQLEVARSGSRNVSVAVQAWKPVHHGMALHAQVEGLVPGSRYLARVRAGNAMGWGMWTEPQLCCTAPDVPDAPCALAVKAVGTTVRVSWDAPEDNGAVIQGYELEMMAGSDGQFVRVFRGEATSHRVTQLQADSIYRLRVRAANAVGVGPYSVVVVVQTSKAPPLPPQEVQAAEASSSATSVEVSWLPVQQGQAEAACVAYEVEAAAALSSFIVRQTCSSRATHTVLTGLQSGCSYAVKVRSVGADGTGHGAWSPTAKVCLRAQRPGEVAPTRCHVGAAAALVARAEIHMKTQKRRGERGGGSQQPPRTFAAVKTAAAKGPPRKGWQVVLSRLVRLHAMRSLSDAKDRTCLIALLMVGALLMLFISWLHL